MTLYDEIGSDKIEMIITEFYRRAFADQIIGHFFFHHDRELLTARQINFASRLLGGPTPYDGRPLLAVHRPLAIRPAHFGRRQVLMRQTCVEFGLDRELLDKWMRLEESLRPMILS